MSLFTIKIEPGAIAPRYPETSKKLELKSAVITENGMESGLPLIDFVMVDDEGVEHYAMISGRHVLNLAATIRGVNLRNHGIEEP